MEGLRRCVVVDDKGSDCLLQLLDAAVNAAPDLSLGQEGEPALDLVEPGGVGRREMQVIARPFGEPCFDRRRLMGGVVVDDEVDIESGRDARRNTSRFR